MNAEEILARQLFLQQNPDGPNWGRAGTHLREEFLADAKTLITEAHPLVVSAMLARLPDHAASRCLDTAATIHLCGCSQVGPKDCYKHSAETELELQSRLREGEGA